MTPHRQLVKHDPEKGQYGDCYRTAIASLLDLHPSEVPNYLRDGLIPAAEYYEKLDVWLAGRGVHRYDSVFDADPEAVLQHMQHHNPGIYYILGCASPKADHSIVCCGDQIVSDPGGYDGGIEGFARGSDGYCWVDLLIPTSQRRPQC